MPLLELVSPTMIASGLQLRNARIPQSRKPVASTPFVLKLDRGIGGCDEVEAYKRYLPVDGLQISNYLRVTRLRVTVVVVSLGYR